MELRLTTWTSVALVVVLSSTALAADGGVHEAWVARYDGPEHGDDEAKDIAVSGEGYVYVVGVSWGGDSGRDVVTAKYGPDGSECWLARYDGPAGLHESGSALTLGYNGDVIVTGGVYDSLSSSKILTVCYDTDGVERWAATYEGPETGENYGYGIASDEHGVYVAGYSWGGLSREDAVTIKYAYDGAELWVARYEGPVDGTDSWSDVALGVDGSVHVVGRSMGGYTSYDALTIKYDSDGNELWVARYDSDIHHDDRGLDIAVTEGGTVCICGISFGGWSPGTEWDYLTVQYDQDGHQKWAAVYDGLASDDDLAFGVAVDWNGNVCVTGGSARTEGDSTSPIYDLVTIEYDSTGQELWLSRYGGDSAGSDFGYDVAVDGEGCAYATGRSHSSVRGFDDYVTLKYDEAGDIVWTARYDGPSGGGDWANALATDGGGNVYVTGGSASADFDRDFATIKYALNPADTSGAPSISLAMSSNPCDGDVSFHLEVPNDVGWAKLELFDLCGRRVRTLLDGPVSGAADVSWDGRDAIGDRAASGIYFVRLRSAGLVVSRKLVVAR